MSALVFHDMPNKNNTIKSTLCIKSGFKLTFSFSRKKATNQHFKIPFVLFFKQSKRIVALKHAAAIKQSSSLRQMSRSFQPLRVFKFTHIRAID